MSAQGSASAEKHKHDSRHKLNISIITVSTSRFRDPSLKDDSGEMALELCRQAGHNSSLEIVDDSKSMIRLRTLESLFKEGKDAVILLGGTGISPRDVTIEAIRPLLDKELEGFGDIFRQVSYDSIGSAALMSRAIAGTIENKPVFCLPGSPDAASTGTNLALKELPHAVFIASSTKMP